MPVEQFANNAVTTLNGAINNSVTSLVVTSATGFSTVPQFRLIIDSEIMLVTAVSGTTFTITRGAEGTTAASHSNGATVAQILTAGGLGEAARRFSDYDYLMPVMTGPTTTVDGQDYSVTETNYIADGGADTYRAWRAMTRSTNDSPAAYYHSATGNSWPHYTTFTLPTAKTVRVVRMRGYSAHPWKWGLEGSSDNSTWTTLIDTQIDFNRVRYPYWYTFFFPYQNAAYRYIRFRVDGSRDGSLTDVSYFNILNLDLWGN